LRPARGGGPLAKKIQSDKALFKELLGPCVPVLERKAPLYLRGSEYLAEDMLAETYLKAWKNFNNFDRSKRFLNWIDKILKNTCLDKLKSKSNDPLEKTVEWRIADRAEDGECLMDLQDTKIWIEDHDGARSLESIRTLINERPADESDYIDIKPGFVEYAYIKTPEFNDRDLTPNRDELEWRYFRVRWNKNDPMPGQVKLFCDAIQGIPIEETCKKLGITVKHGRVLLTRFKKKAEEDKKRKL
jgi:RNA polymerase sigma factor (sigma-70 family)